MKKYLADYNRYSFKSEDDWGDYDNGNYRRPYFNKLGYSSHSYLCNDGKFHTMSEHTVKWEYFNGRIPEGLEIDHIIPIKNGGTNKLSNLRLVTHEGNMNNKITLKKIKESTQDEIRNKKISTALKGRKQTKEHIKNAAKGRWKKVYQYNLDNNLIKIWNNPSEAAENGFCYRNITRCCRGERKSHKGYLWSYEPL